MTTICRAPWSRTAVGCMLSFVLLPSAAAAIEWALPNSGDFDVASNWNPSSVPGALDSAQFNEAGTYTVTFNANQSSSVLVFDAGDVTFRSDGTDRTYSVTGLLSDAFITGGTLTLGVSGDPLHMSVGDELRVISGGALNILHGSEVEVGRLRLGATCCGTGDLVVDGDGSALHVLGTSGSSIGGGGSSGSLVVRNAGEASFNGTLDIGWSNSNGLQTGTLDVISDFGVVSVSAGGTINLANGTGDEQTGRINVNGNLGSFVQTGSDDLNIGSATVGSSGQINLDNGGAFTTGTGTTTINATGEINISSGIFDLRGNINTTSGATITNNDTFNLNGGTVNVDGTLDLLGNGLFVEGMWSGAGVGDLLNAGTNVISGSSSGTTVSNLRINDGVFQNVSLDNGTVLTNPTFSVAGSGIVGTDVQISGTLTNSTSIGITGTMVVTGSGLTLTGGGIFSGHSNSTINGNSVGTINNLDNRIGGGFQNRLALQNLQLLQGSAAVIGGGVDLDSVDLVGGTIVAMSAPTIFSVAPFTVDTPSTIDGIVQIQGGVAIFKARLLPTGEIRLQYPSQLTISPESLDLDGKLRAEAGASVNIPVPGVYDWSDGTVSLADDTTHTIAVGATLILTTQLEFDNLVIDNSSTGFVRNMFGASPVVASGQSLVVVGTTSLNDPLRIDGGIFTTGALSSYENLDFRGGEFHLTQDDLLIEPGSAGPVFDVSNGSILTVDQQIDVGIASRLVVARGTVNGNTLSNNGDVDAIEANVTFSGAALNPGDINSIDSTLDFSGGLNNSGHLNLINTTVAGNVNNNGTAALAGTNTFTGTVDGSGDFTGTGTAAFEGTFSPGNSPAEINFGGDMTLTSSATLEMELGGTTPGSGHDKINVAGTATLGGVLDVLLINGFENSIISGTQFTIIDATTLAGTFANIAPGGRLAIEEFGGDIRVDYGAGSPFDPNLVVLSDFTFIPLVATWIDGASNWTTSANWDINTVPNNGPPLYDAIVPTGTATVDAPIEVRALTVSAGGAVQVDNDLTVTQNAQFTGGAVDVAAGATLALGGNVLFHGGASYTGQGVISLLGATVQFENGQSVILTSQFNIGEAAHTIIGQNDAVALNVDQIDDDNTIDGIITINRGGTLNIGQSTRSFWQTSAVSTINFENQTPASSFNQIAGPSTVIQGTVNVNGGLVRMRSNTTLRADPNFVPGNGVSRATVNMNPQGILRFDNIANLEDVLITGGGTLRFLQESTAVATISADADIDVDAFETVQNGTVNINGSKFRVGAVTLDSGSVSLDAAASFEVSDVGSTPGAGLFVGSSGGTGTVSIDNGAALNTVNATIAAGGSVAIIDGTFTSTNAIQLTGGQLSGSGVAAADINNAGGTVAPGLSPGILSETGNFTQGASGTLAIEIGGTTLGTQYDQLAITGNAMLDGILDVSLIDLGGGLFSPMLNDSFTILTTTAGLSGVFATTVANLPALATGLRWEIDYGANDVILNVLAGFTADFDNDGDVDGDDLAQWQGDYGLNGFSDADSDGDSDGRDFLAWQRQFGSGVPAPASSQTVPEPNALLLAAFGLLTLSTWQKRA